MKRVAIGRKNWLFFGSDDGGRRLAILSSFTATCQQFGVNPWTWLQETLTRLPATPADHDRSHQPGTHCTPDGPASDDHVVDHYASDDHDRARPATDDVHDHRACGPPSGTAGDARGTARRGRLGASDA